MIFLFERDTNHSYFIKDLDKEEILGKFYEKLEKMFRIKVNHFLNYMSIDQLSWIFFTIELVSSDV